MRARAVGVALLLLAGGCGQAGVPVAQESPPSTAPPPTSPMVATPPGAGFPRPPAVILRAGGRETVLDIWSSCWSSGNGTGCGDGHPPDTPPDIGGPPEVEVAFDAPGWRFSATAMPTGNTCSGRQEAADLVSTGPTTHRLLPMGKAGDYTITLFGSSTDTAINQGDIATTFRWHTPRNGPSEAPTVTMSLLATPAEAKVSLGAELSAQSLGVSTTAGAVSASAVVTTATGAAMTVEFHPHPGLECVPDGSFFLRSDGEDGRRLTGLGPAPYRYDVTLTIAGTRYRGSGTWPQDVVHDCSPCVPLRWSPPLPAL